MLLSDFELSGLRVLPYNYKTSTMNGVWLKIYPGCIADIPGFEEPVSNVHLEIAGMALKDGFNEIYKMI